MKAQEHPQIAALKKFARSGDRSHSPFFTGREEILSLVTEHCQEALELAREGKALQGNTILLQGAPGAGKTAILTELKTRFEKDESLPAPLMISANDTPDPDEILRRIARKAGREMPRKAEKERKRTLGGKAHVRGNIGILRARAKIQARTRKGRRVDEHVKTPGLTGIGEAMPREQWTRPMCLMIDEIQRIKHKSGRARQLIQDLQDNVAGLPIVPLYSGLTNAREILGRMDMYPLAEDLVHKVDRMRPAEAKATVRKMLAHFAADCTGADANDWADMLSEDSDLWPQHLHNGLRALAEELAAKDRKLADVDRQIVLDRSRSHRIRSYQGRATDKMRQSRFIIRRIMDMLSSGPVDVSKVVEEVESCSRSRNLGWRMPENSQGETMDSEEFLGYLMGKGALFKDRDNKCLSPIPSFSWFLQQRGALDTELHDAAFSLDMEKAKELLAEGDVDPCARNSVGDTPLHVAARRGCSDIAEALAKKADRTDGWVNIRNENGATPLHEAAKRGDVRTARLLVEQGARCGVRELEDGNTPLHEAVKAGATEVAQFLLMHQSADPDIRNFRRETPLHIAASQEDMKTAELLVESRASKEARTLERDGRDRTPFDCAREAGNDELARMLQPSAQGPATDSGTPGLLRRFGKMLGIRRRQEPVPGAVPGHRKSRSS